ncbi:ATP-grasp fold amidoligase family protein [Kocuria rosea]|nr:ATP-grasp fold amidoligase family protein [Kocuria rosea]WJZ68275.1 ATP-grasp fold amidoligase family protein [Kocuria rosea]
MRRYVVHAVKHRRLLRLRRPQTFNEKLSWRMVYDRREILKVTCDKKAMKVLAHERAGDLVRVPRTLWSGTDVRELEPIELPERWVLKPNHRSGLVYIGEGQPRIDELRRITKGWLEEVHWRRMGEWAYSHAEPALIVEEFIGEAGSVPVDYKFQVFDGQVRVVLVYLGRFEELRGYVMDRNFVRIEVQDASERLRADEVINEPPNFARMVEVAERIASGFDYLRVDLYDTGDDVWFGETTVYEANGGAKYRPASFDVELGSYWNLPGRDEVRPR